MSGPLPAHGARLRGGMWHPSPREGAAALGADGGRRGAYLRHTLWGRPGVSSGKKPSLQAGMHLQSWKRKFGAQ